MKLCFIGLGTMGTPMTQCLLDAGYSVTSWDLSDSAGKALPGRCATLAEAAGPADLIITMLPEGAHVSAVLREILALERTGRRLFIDSSTIDVTTARTLAQEADAAGHGFIDAPVSGGAEGARAGSLSFMLGGAAADIETARPVLETLGAKMMHFGEAGTGQAAKACHNMICGITALAVCESFALADSLGLDLEKFHTLCKGAAAQSWILENRCPVPGPAPNAPASNGYAPGFAARLMAKDLRLAQAAAEASGQETVFGAQAAQRFTEHASDTASGDLDFSAIYRKIRTT